MSDVPIRDYERERDAAWASLDSLLSGLDVELAEGIRRAFIGYGGSSFRIGQLTAARNAAERAERADLEADRAYTDGYRKGQEKGAALVRSFQVGLVVPLHELWALAAGARRWVRADAVDRAQRKIMEAAEITDSEPFVPVIERGKADGAP